MNAYKKTAILSTGRSIPQVHSASTQSHLRLVTVREVPVFPGASIVQASRVTSARAPSGFHGLDLATRASLDEVKRFYTDALNAKGFAVDDLGIAPLNPAAAAWFGQDRVSKDRGPTEPLAMLREARFACSSA